MSFVVRPLRAIARFWQAYGAAHETNRRAFFAYSKIHRANKRVYRGRAQEDAGELERAYNDYRDALRIDPKNAQALYGVGLTLYESAYLDPSKVDARLAEAEQALTESLEIVPDVAGAHYCRGLVLSERWRRADGSDAELARSAVNDMSRACELDPEQWGYWCAKGMALTKLAESYEQEPAHGRAFCHQAVDAFQVSIRLGGGAFPREEWADTLLTDALTLDNPQPEPLLTNAVQLFEEAETFEELRAGSYWRWALTLETLAREHGDESRSEHVTRVLSLLDTALRLDPDSDSTRELRDEILARTNS